MAGCTILGMGIMMELSFIGKKKGRSKQNGWWWTTHHLRSFILTKDLLTDAFCFDFYTYLILTTTTLPNITLFLQSSETVMLMMIAELYSNIYISVFLLLLRTRGVAAQCHKRLHDSNRKEQFLKYRYI